MSSLVALKVGRLIDGTGADALENAVVITKDDQIEKVGPACEVQIPKDAEVIDASDKTVIPGLIDIHHHIGGNFGAIRTLRMTLQRGITTVGSVSGDVEGCKLRDSINEGHIPGVSRFWSAGMVTPTNGHVGHRCADGPWEVRKAVREMAQATCDFIKTAASGGFWGEHEDCSVRNYTLEELEALVDEAHAWNLPVAVHCHTQPGLNNSIKAGVDQIHHGAFIDEEAVEGILERNLYYIPTLRVTCAKNIAAWPDRPWMREEMEQSSPIHRKGVRYAHELGVQIGVGTDGPGSARAWTPGDSTPWELMELVQCGLSPMEAIVAATQTTADAMGKLDVVGTLTSGKKADLVVLGRNPLDDISCIYEQDNILLVMRDGIVQAYRGEEYAKHYRLPE